MAETIRDVLADLERKGNAPAQVLEKLRNATHDDVWYRAYTGPADDLQLTDVLSETELRVREYTPRGAAVTMRGDGAADRDVAREHTTHNSLFETLWIGEALSQGDLEEGDDE